MHIAPRQHRSSRAAALRRCAAAPRSRELASSSKKRKARSLGRGGKGTCRREGAEARASTRESLECFRFQPGVHPGGGAAALGSASMPLGGLPFRHRHGGPPRLLGSLPSYSSVQLLHVGLGYVVQPWLPRFRRRRQRRGGLRGGACHGRVARWRPQCMAGRSVSLSVLNCRGGLELRGF